jgi:hypothetical protein
MQNVMHLRRSFPRLETEHKKKKHIIDLRHILQFYLPALTLCNARPSTPNATLSL